MQTWMFTDTNTSNSNFSERILQSIAKENIPAFAKINIINDMVDICIAKGGKSELKLKITKRENVLCIDEISRNIIFIHKPFVGMVENIVNNIMLNAGFKRI